MTMRVTAEVLTIGNELLRGKTLNTNARFLGRRLTEAGFEVRWQSSCRDSCEEIQGHLGKALKRADVVILSGGLGPTPDDVTREGVAGYFDVPLAFSKVQYHRIVRHYHIRGRRVPKCVRREALFPRNSKPLINRFGIALGFYISLDRKLAVVLPGVPSELEKMYDALVAPLLKRRFPGSSKFHSFLVKMSGISEPQVVEKLGKRFFEEDFDVGIYPHFGIVTLSIRCLNSGLMGRLRRQVERKLGRYIFATEDEPIAGVIGNILSKRRMSLALAESSTAGALAREITNVPGSSRYFKGGVVAYHNTIKERWLGISDSVLQKKGAVSREVAAGMAKAIRERMRSSYGVSVTGIAGPGGGSRKKPVGTVFVAISSARKTRVWRYQLLGDRDQIRERTVIKALSHLWEELKR